jgi:hypothetical protein
MAGPLNHQVVQDVQLYVVVGGRQPMASLQLVASLLAVGTSTDSGHASTVISDHVSVRKLATSALPAQLTGWIGLPRCTAKHPGSFRSRSTAGGCETRLWLGNAACNLRVMYG